MYGSRRRTLRNAEEGRLHACLRGMRYENVMGRDMIENIKFMVGNDTTKNWWIHSIGQTMWTRLNEVNQNECIENEKRVIRENSKSKRSLGKPTSRWEDGIKKGFMKARRENFEDRDWKEIE